MNILQGRVLKAELNLSQNEPDYKKENCQDLSNSYQTLRLKNIPLRRRNTRKITQHVIMGSLNKRQTKVTNKNKKKETLIFKKSKSKLKEEQLTCEEKFKKRANYIMDLPSFIIIMSILTSFALFLSDIQTAWCPPSCDFPFDLIQLFIFISFTIEILISSYVDPSYFCSLFFWLDTVSTLSLFLDVNFISDKFLGTLIFVGNSKYKYQLALTKISTASGTTRVLRILRIIKLIRIVKLYKTVHQAQSKVKEQEEEEKKKMKMKLLNNSKSQTDSSTHDPYENSQRENIRIGKKDKDKRRISEIILSKRRIHLHNKGKRNQLFQVQNKEEVKEENEDEIGKIQKYDDISDETLQESTTSKIIVDQLNKKIFCLVLIILIVYPFLSDDFYFTGKETISYNILIKYLEAFYILCNDTYIRSKDHLITASSNKFFPIINITLNGTVIYDNTSISWRKYRADETRTLFSPTGLIELNFSVFKETTLTATLNFFRTVFICILVALSVWSIESSVKTIVLNPLEIIMEIVDKVCKDPENAKDIIQVQSGTKATIDKYGNIDNKDQYELKTIKHSIIRISGLLSMGFGKIGARIIRRNLVNNRLYFKEKGRIVAAIFGKFKLLNHIEINKKFGINSITLINNLAEIIHETVDLYSGEILRNSGEDVVCIWKFSSKNFTLSNSGIPQEEERYLSKNKDGLSKDKLAYMVNNISDLALLACLRIYRKICKKANSFINDCTTKINIGFCLHLGYSVEGVIGSIMKIDTVYISKSTEIVNDLEDATLYYGTPLIFTDFFYSYLSPTVKQLCRQIDSVYFNFDDKKINLYTLDMNNDLPISNKSHVYLSIREKEIIHEEKKKKLFEGINSVGNVTQSILSRRSFHEVIDSGIPEEFYYKWRKAMKLYEEGNWRAAKLMFNECLEIKEDDIPAKKLISFIEENKGRRPHNWHGARKFPLGE